MAAVVSRGIGRVNGAIAMSFVAHRKLFALEIIVDFARLGGRAVGIVANQPRVKGGVLFVDSSDKATRFINTCNAFNIPLLFLADFYGIKCCERVFVLTEGRHILLYHVWEDDFTNGNRSFGVAMENTL